METTTKVEQIEFTRIAHDVNGNPRAVCHFLQLVSVSEKKQADNMDAFKRLDWLYAKAIKRSRALGGKKFHNKQYGGGIVFQMYRGQEREYSQRISELLAENK
jgi:hypothetical protein